MFELRLALEGLAVRFAVQRGRPGHWERMAAVLARLSSAEEQVGNEQLIAIDTACHEIIYDAADNKFLRSQCITHYALSLRLWYYFLQRIGDMRGAIEEHVQLLHALQASDEALAVRLMEQHIHAFQDEIQAVMIGGGATPAQV